MAEKKMAKRIKKGVIIVIYRNYNKKSIYHNEGSYKDENERESVIEQNGDHEVDDISILGTPCNDPAKRGYVKLQINYKTCNTQNKGAIINLETCSTNMFLLDLSDNLAYAI